MPDEKKNERLTPGTGDAGPIPSAGGQYTEPLTPHGRRSTDGVPAVVLPLSTTDTGTHTARAFGAAAGAGVKAAMEAGSGGLTGIWKTVGNFTWMSAAMILLFMIYTDKKNQDGQRWDYERMERARDREDAIRREERAREENNKRNELIAMEMKALAAGIATNQESTRSILSEFRSLTSEFRAVLQELKSFKK